MISTFKIFKPSRRLCPGKSTKFPISNHNPSSWLKHDSQTHAFASVDGFIVDQLGGTSAIMSRYEYEGKYSDRNEVANQLVNRFGEEIKTQIKISVLLNVPYRIFIWPSEYPNAHSKSEKQIIVFFPKLQHQETDLADAKLINLKGLQSGIKKYRGRSFNAVKSLSSSNSNLECYLANQTKNPWPGDLDGLLMDKATNKINTLLEYKTHNIDSPIEKEFIGRYGKQDWRRFEVLYKLQSAIEKAQGLRPKLFFIVWGTQDIANHNKLKIDQIEDGKILNSKLIDRPPFGVYSEALIDILLAT